MGDEVGAGFLADEAGVPVRSIQFWTDAGVLRALPASDRQGRGKHRVYDASPPFHGERAYALIAAELSRLRLPVGVMRAIVNSFRHENERRGPTWTPSMELALRGHRISLLFSVSEEKDGFNMVALGGDMSALQKAEALDDFQIDGRSGYFLNLTTALSPLVTPRA